MLRATHSPEATAKTTHILRKWTIKTNLNLNIQASWNVKNLLVQGLETNLGPLTTLSGTGSSTLKMSAFDLVIFAVFLIFG